MICAASALVACNKATPETMASFGEQVAVNCDPEVLTLIDGKVKATLEVTFPRNYFFKQARMIVDPVLVCSDGTEIPGKSFIFQGEDVKDNYTVVRMEGSSVREWLEFDYRDPMLRCRLELRPRILASGKDISVPAFKVADGVCTTVAWADLDGYCDYKADNYQAVLHKTAEVKIMYNVGSSKVRKDQLNNSGVEYYQEKIEDIRKDDRYTIKGTKIVSYASPEGGKKYNEKLSERRSGSAQQAWKVVGKGMEAEGTEVQSLGQDWEGFKEAVAKSGIRDKDLILRVLSMYNDPAVREKEIRNLSQIYTELKKDVFPKLRRSQFVTEMDFRNYSEEDLAVLAEQKIYMLDEEGLLRLASVTDNSARKEFIYNFAYEKFGSARATYNLAVQAYKEDRLAAVAYHLDRLGDEEDPAVINMRGLLKLCEGKDEQAEDLFEKAADDQGRSNLGVLYLSRGNFAKAASVIPEGDPNKAVACIMAGQYDAAAASLSSDESARGAYLRAVVCARREDVKGIRDNLNAAYALDPSLKERAAKDVEFVKFVN